MESSTIEPVKTENKGTERTNLVAVYGTLRRDFWNHGLFKVAGYDHVGDGTTVNKHTLMVDGLPYLFKEPATCPIKVEVYAVDDKGLKNLDRLEQHPRWYCREEIPIQLENGEVVTAWLYFQTQGKPVKDAIEASGDYAASKTHKGRRW